MYLKYTELTDAERTYYEYHGKTDDGECIVTQYANLEQLALEGRVIA